MGTFELKLYILVQNDSLHDCFKFCKNPSGINDFTYLICRGSLILEHSIVNIHVIGLQTFMKGLDQCIQVVEEMHSYYLGLVHDC